MPRLNHSVPKYRKHRASGQAVVTLNGRDFYLGPHGTSASKVEYDRLIAEFLATGRAVAYGQAPQALTIVEVAADYVLYAKSYYGTGVNSEIHRIKPAIRPLLRLYGNSAAIDFGPQQLKAVRNVLIEQGNARSTINQAIARIVRMFRWATAEGILPAAVPQALAMVPGLRRGKTNARESEPVLPVDDKIVETTLPHLSPIVADMVRLQRLTGARPAELCKTRPCDLEWKGDVLLYRPETHKTQYLGRDRTIAIGPKGQAILTPYLKRDALEYCFCPREAVELLVAKKRKARKTPLSRGNRAGTNRRLSPIKTAGGSYTVASYRRAIHNACDKAFLHPALSVIPRKEMTAEQVQLVKAWQSSHRWSPNQLRHAAATQIRRDFGLEAAQVTLGHAQAKVTQIYAERDLAKGIEVAKLIG